MLNQKIVSEKFDNNKTINIILEDLKKKIKCHTLATEYYRKWSRIIDIPSAIVPIFFTVVFGKNISDTNTTNTERSVLGYISIILSCSLSILNVLRGYFSFGELSASHKNAVKLYTQILNKLDSTILRAEMDKNIDSTQLYNIYKELLSQLETIEQNIKTVPEHIYKLIYQLDTCNCPNNIHRITLLPDIINSISKNVSLIELGKINSDNSANLNTNTNPKEDEKKDNFPNNIILTPKIEIEDHITSIADKSSDIQQEISATKEIKIHSITDFLEYKLKENISFDDHSIL